MTVIKNILIKKGVAILFLLLFTAVHAVQLQHVHEHKQQSLHSCISKADTKALSQKCSICEYQLSKNIIHDYIQIHLFKPVNKVEHSSIFIISKAEVNSKPRHGRGPPFGFTS